MEEERDTKENQGVQPEDIIVTPVGSDDDLARIMNTQFGALVEEKPQEPEVDTSVAEVASETASPEAIESLRADIKDQIPNSLQATNALLADLKSQGRHETQPVTEAELTAAVEAKLEQWVADGSLERAAAQQQRLGGRMWLEATPNVALNADEIFGLMDGFSGEEASISRDFVRQYSDEQLSGEKQGDGSVRIRLFHDKFDRLDAHTVEELKAARSKALAETPSRIVPSILEGIVNFYTQRTAGVKLIAMGIEKTSVLCYNLPVKPLGEGRWLCVPDLELGWDGDPGLGGMSPDDNALDRFVLG